MFVTHFCSSLFSFFADCLIGDFDAAKKNIPTHIRLLKQEIVVNGTDQITSITDYSSAIYVRTLPVKVNSSSYCGVRYSFIIPQDLWSSEYSHIGLYSNKSTSITEYAAIAKLTDDISRSGSSVLVVDWELIIKNKED